MICDELFPDLSARADGEADAAALSRLDRHVPFCEQCQDRTRDLERVRGEINRLVNTPPPADFAERAARHVRERRARRSPWERVSPFFSAIARGDRWTRIAASIATGLLVLGSGATAAGAMLHWVTYQGLASPEAVADLAFWTRLLPDTAGDLWALEPVALWHVLSLLILVCGAVALGIPALARDVLRGVRVPLSRGVAAFAGLYLLGVAALVPPLSRVVIEDWFLNGSASGWATVLGWIALALTVWRALLVVTAFSCLLARSVRGVPAAAAIFTGCWAVSYASESLEIWLRTPPANASFFFRDLAMVPVLLRPSQLVNEIMLGGLVLGAVVATTLGACLSYGGPSLRPRLTTAAALGLLTVAWLWHGATVAAPLQAPPRPAPAALASADRTVAVLLSDPRRDLKTSNRGTTNPDGTVTIHTRGGKELPLVACPLPGELVAMAAAVQSYRTGPFHSDTPWAYGVLTNLAALEWDETRILALSEEIVERTPGFGEHGRYLRWRLPSLPVFSAAMRDYLRKMHDRFSPGSPQRRFATPTGGLRGRLFIDGRPAKGVLVRVLTDQNLGGTWDIDARGRRQVSDNILGDLRYECRWPAQQLALPASDTQAPYPAAIPIATRTAVDGTFRFDHLSERGYFLAVLLDGKVTSVRAEGSLTAPSQAEADARMDRLIDIAWVRDEMVDMGDIRLRVQR